MPIDFSNAWRTGVRLVNQRISLLPNSSYFSCSWRSLRSEFLDAPRRRMPNELVQLQSQTHWQPVG